MSYQKKDGRGHARPSFFWYDNDKDLKVCFPVTCHLNPSSRTLKGIINDDHKADLVSWTKDDSKNGGKTLSGHSLENGGNHLKHSCNAM